MLYKCLPTTLTHDGGVLPPFLTHDGKFCLDLSKWKKNLSKTLSPTKNHETRAYTYMTIHIGVAARQRRASLRHPDMNSHIGMVHCIMVFRGRKKVLRDVCGDFPSRVIMKGVPLPSWLFVEGSEDYG